MKKRSIVDRNSCAPSGQIPSPDAIAVMKATFPFGDRFVDSRGDHGPVESGPVDPPNLRALLRIVAEQIPTAIFVAFFDGSFAECYLNQEVQNSLGYTDEELRDDPIRWFERVHPDEKERCNDELIEMLSTYEPLHSNYRLKTKDGRDVPFQCDVRVIRNTEGDPWFIHGTAFYIKGQSDDEGALREYAERMKVLSKSLIDVQEVERRRIALELHDQIGQMLTGLKLKLEMLARKDPSSSPSGFDEAQELVNELILRTRELSLDLRPATLDHLGLLSALRRHLRHYQAQTGVEVEFHHEGLESRRFVPDLETAAFRIVQEGLTNVARHASVSRASVFISCGAKRLLIEIEDAGVGFDTTEVFGSGQSSGLTGMRERSILIGGIFEVESGENGTLLRAEWELTDDLENK